MASASTLPGWIAWVEPLSVPFLVVAAIGAVVWEIKRDRERRDAADTEVSARAYALRRDLRVWVPLPADYEERFRLIQRHTDDGPMLESREDRILDLVTTAGRASASVAQAARKAYVAYLRARLLMNELKSMKVDYRRDPDSGERLGPRESDEIRRHMAEINNLLSECVGALGEAIDSQLTTTEEDLDARGEVVA